MSPMEIVITFEAPTVLFKKSVENGYFLRFLPHAIFKKLTGMVRYLQISTKLSHNQVKLFIFTRCVHAFNYLMCGTLSPSLLPFR